jgi:hypothetical protein
MAQQVSELRSDLLEYWEKSKQSDEYVSPSEATAGFIAFSTFMYNCALASNDRQTILETAGQIAELKANLIADAQKVRPELARYDPTVQKGFNTLRHGKNHSIINVVDALDEDAPDALIYSGGLRALTIAENALHALAGRNDHDIATLSNNAQLFYQTVQYAEGRMHEPTSEIPETPIQPTTVLDFEILPPGKLHEHAQSIVESINKSRPAKQVTIDLSRMDEMENFRQRWGTDSARYIIGAFNSRGTVEDPQTGERVPNAYISLVLFNENPDDNPDTPAVGFIADSPVTGEHGMYVGRQDVSAHIELKELIATNKPAARRAGARSVAHSANGNSMSEKAWILMRVDADEFTRVRFDGKRGKGYWLLSSGMKALRSDTRSKIASIGDVKEGAGRSLDLAIAAFEPLTVAFDGLMTVHERLLLLGRASKQADFEAVASSYEAAAEKIIDVFEALNKAVEAGRLVQRNL